MNIAWEEKERNKIGDKKHMKSSYTTELIVTVRVDTLHGLHRSSVSVHGKYGSDYSKNVSMRSE
jgi:hypothetical protein